MKEVQMVDTEQPITLAEIERVENKFNIKFPEDYKLFLLRYNGGGPIENVYPLIEPIRNDKEKGAEADIAWFQAIYDGEHENMEKTIFRTRNRMPKEFIPIARSSGGGKICICVKGKNYGKMYFWNHEEEAEEGQEPTYNNLYLIAHSFTDFINSLSERPEEE